MHVKTFSNLHYFSLQIYQLSNALPLYKRLDGRFICRDIKRFVQFKRNLRNLNATGAKQTLFNAPAALIRSKNNLQNIAGIIFSLSNTVLNYDRRHGLKHIYFSNPAAIVKSDTLADFIVSDIMISDTSSILYEYLVTGKPIIVATNAYKNLHKMPPELDILQHVPLFTGEEKILDIIEAALADKNLLKNLDKLFHHCFYFNDGQSSQRAIDFIKSLQPKT